MISVVELMQGRWDSSKQPGSFYKGEYDGNKRLSELYRS